MKKKSVFLWLTVCAIVLFTMACSLSDTVSNTVSSLFNTTKLQPDIIRAEAHGFQYQIPVNYDGSGDSSFIELYAKDSDSMAGPVIRMQGGITDTGQTDQALLDEVLKEGDTLTFSSSKKISVNGKTGLGVTFTGTLDDKAVEGRLLAIMVSPTQSFLMVGIAPEGQWKTVNKVFEKVMSTIKFFEPNPNAG